MPDITPDREALARLRVRVADGERALAAARARAQIARDELAAFARIAKPNDRADAARSKALATAAQEAERAALSAKSEDLRTRGDLFGQLGAFADRHDPRTLMPEMDDGTPLLLFPIRVETRFKQTGRATELWVRIYPDACLVESFDELLSTSELFEARQFWMRWWRAGGVDADQRAAWRSLVAATGASRATWVVRAFRPFNEFDAPVKADPRETLVVVSITPFPSVTERTAVAQYWTSVWRDPVAAGAPAQAALEAAVGASRATELIGATPFNLGDDPAEPLTRDTAPVRVVFLSLPDDTLTTARTWSSAPVVRTLPERFVLRAERADDVPLEVVGRAIPSPLVVGPDPEADETDQLSQTDGVLKLPAAIRWMVDFDEAVNIGMGFRVPLTPQQAANGFDRLLVIGVRQTSDANESTNTLATLIAHHRFGATGFSLVPQGTPTNNTEAAPSGFDRHDDPDASYDATFAPAQPTTTVWEDKLDGQWLSELLGIPQSAIDGVEHARGRDQIVGRAMGTALWPATLGYMLETLMHPVFSSDIVDGLRWFHNHFVSGRGWVPAVRVGKQPYGILPTSAMSRWRWVTDKVTVPADGAGAPTPAGKLLVPLLRTLRQFESDWDALSQRVSAVGKAGDPHQLLLDILGLHPTSVEYYQRYAQSLDSIRARVRLLSAVRNSPRVLDTAAWQNDARALLRQLGYTGPTDPDILSRIFYGAQQPMQGPLIDDRLLSETDPVRAYTDDKRNYLHWLIDTARLSLDELRAEHGFTADQPPTALLYLMLRHALILGYWDTSVRLFINAGVLDTTAQATVRREAPFVHVAAQQAPSESRWAMLYSDDVRVTGTQGRLVADHITRILGTQTTRHLDEQLAALERLKDAPTAQLERAFAEHVDCASYRLDAWVQGMIHAQLSVMRASRGQDGQPQAKPGIHLGAFGWLEEVRPHARQRADVQLPPDLADFFAPAGSTPLVSDATNGGYMMTPSLNHAVTAAVLRSGYLANSSAANPESFSVNLSSARVRVARQILEGIRNGQSLGALLGYRLERGLHDRHTMAEVDRFILALRKQFPLRSDRLDETRTLPGVSIESIEARNVVDGALLVDRVRSTGNASYPFGLDLPNASPAQLAAINAAVDDLLDASDAVADLALAESVHQATQGNFDRAAANLDAYGKGGLPPDPDVIRTPLSGTIITHRVAVHLAADASPTVSPVVGVAMSPRAASEPGVNAWLGAQLPAPDRVYCRVHVTNAITGVVVVHEITQRNLALQPIDLLDCVVDASAQGMGELEDRITRHAQAFVQRPDDTIEIAFTELVADRTKVSFFELAPQLRALRTLVDKARALRATDLRLAGEAGTAEDQSARIDATRVEAARTALDAARGPLDAVITSLSTLLVDSVANRVVLLAGADTAVTSAANAAVPLLSFGVRAAIGEWYAWRSTISAKLVATVRTRLGRWNDRNEEAVARLTAYDLLPGTTPDEQRFTELESIQRLVASSAVVPRPPSVLVSRAQTGIALAAFQTKLTALTSAIQTATPTFAALRAGIVAQLPIDAFDVDPFNIDDIDDEVVRHLDELASALRTIRTDVDARLDVSRDLLDDAASATDAAAHLDLLTRAAKTVFGEAFTIVPKFDIPVTSRGELAGAMAHSASGELLRFQRVERANREPVDTWLYGIARVRDAMHTWEKIVMHAETFGAASAALTPIQLPASPAQRWLALEYPDDTVLNGDRLCYTAHYVRPFDPNTPQCGLLIDEWTEVIPATDQTAAIAFHFDRPNAEPPQVWLLATPSNFGTGWSWDDVVDSVNEAFERAQRRAVEPEHIDPTPYARFLPATITATTVFPIAIAANLARNNGLLEAQMSDA